MPSARPKSAAHTDKHGDKPVRKTDKDLPLIEATIITWYQAQMADKAALQRIGQRKAEFQSYLELLKEDVSTSS